MAEECKPDTIYFWPVNKAMPEGWVKETVADVIYTSSVPLLIPIVKK